MCLLTLLTPVPSYAGHWVITLNGSTSAPGTTGTGNYTFANSQVTGPAPYSATSHIYFNLSGSSCALGLPGTLSAAATLTWTPDSPTDTSQPPPTVDVLETASAGGAEWMLQPTGVSASASDGFGDPVTNPTAPVYGASSSGKHLYHMTVSPGQMSVTLPTRSLSASLTYATAITTSSTNESMGYAVQPDTREVSITRNNARSPGKVYSPDGQLHGEYQDASGTWHGETTYSYLQGLSASDTSPTLNGNWQYFMANLAGGWTQKTIPNLLGANGSVPDVTWAWTPNESEDTLNEAKCEMPQGGITYNSDGTSTGKAASSAPYPVTYTATDNGDGAKASASYALVVHEQWDNLRLDPSHPFDVVDNIKLVQINGQNYPVQVNPDYTIPMPIGPLTLGGTIGLQFSAQLNGSFKLSDFFTLGGNFTATGSIAVTANQAINGAPIPPRCYVQLTYEVHYHTNHWMTDHYLPSGYDSTYTQLIDDQKDAVTSLFWGHPIQLAGSGLGGA